MAARVSWLNRAALASVTLLMAASPASGQAPPGTDAGAASPGTAPEWLVAGELPWYGSPDGGMGRTDDRDIWVGRLDGGDLRLLGSSDNDEVAVASDERVVTGRRTDEGQGELVVYAPVGTERVLRQGIACCVVAVDADGDAAYAWDDEGRDRIGWLMRVPLDGSAVEERVLPPDSCCRAVVSADERSVAGAPGSHMSPGRIVVRFDGGPVRRLFPGWPIGFDALGRLIAWDLRRVVRYDPVTREIEPLRTETMRLTRNAHVSPDGRYLVAIPDGLNLHILDLIDGDRRTIPLEPPRRWSSDPVAFHGDLAVFEGVDWPTINHAVVSLRDGWVDYVSRTADG